MNILITHRPAQVERLRPFCGNDWYLDAVPVPPRTLPADPLGIDPNDNFRTDWVPEPSCQPALTRLKAQLPRAASLFLLDDGTPQSAARSWHLRRMLSLPDTVPVRLISLSALTLVDWQIAIEQPQVLNPHRARAGVLSSVLDRLWSYLISPVLTEQLGRAVSLSRAELVALAQLHAARDRWQIVFDATSADGMSRKIPLYIRRAGSTQPLALTDRDRAHAIGQRLMSASWQAQPDDDGLAALDLMAQAEAAFDFTPAHTLKLLHLLYDSGQVRSTDDIISPLVTGSADTDAGRLLRLMASHTPANSCIFQREGGTAFLLHTPQPPQLIGVDVMPLQLSQPDVLRGLVHSGFDLSTAVAATAALHEKELVELASGNVTLTTNGTEIADTLHSAFPVAGDARLAVNIARKLQQVASGDVMPGPVLRRCWRLLQTDLNAALTPSVPQPVRLLPEGVSHDDA